MNNTNNTEFIIKREILTDANGRGSVEITAGEMKTKFKLRVSKWENGNYLHNNTDWWMSKQKAYSYNALVSAFPSIDLEEVEDRYIIKIKGKYRGITREMEEYVYNGRIFIESTENGVCVLHPNKKPLKIISIVQTEKDASSGYTFLNFSSPCGLFEDINHYSHIQVFPYKPQIDYSDVGGYFGLDVLGLEAYEQDFKSE
jgi:hypothetical protein